MPTATPTMPPTPPPSPDIDPQPIDFGDFHCGTLGVGFCGLYESNDTAASAMIETLTAEDFERELNPEYLSGDFRLAVLYRQATALEALARSDEALAAYVENLHACAGSPWGRLAALHLEPMGVN
ncbi:MAG: hypothetical protein IPK52_12795 [Chloroflexi bacterium]|nr:hypothetical protein [Chloroflexota bacterium]